MKAKLTYGKLSFEWETPENDVGVVLRQILSAYPDREPVPATVSELKPIEVPEPESEEEPEAPIEEEPAPERPQTIPPEPTEREPLGKAIQRLQEEKKMLNASQSTDGKVEKKKGQRGGKLNTCSVVLRKDGDVKWFETMLEASLFLDCSLSSVSRAVKNKTTINGWWVEKDEPQTKL